MRLNLIPQFLILHFDPFGLRRRLRRLEAYAPKLRDEANASPQLERSEKIQKTAESSLKNLFNKPYRYHFQNDQSPTHIQLARFMQSAGFKPTQWPWRANFSEQNLNLAPDLCECLEFKHRLAQFVQFYCPEVMPETYLFDEYSWSASLSDIAETHYKLSTYQFNDSVASLAWILKPALLNNGQHIKIFDKISQMESYFLSPQHLGGPHVLQRYIHDPDLIAGRKYSLRMFVVITQEAGAFLYQHGYVNVAKAQYDASDFTHLGAHLTNEHLNHDSNVVQIPTSEIAAYSAWYPQIRMIVKTVTAGLETAFPHAFAAQKERTFAVFGFDFMIDSQKRAWLLEVNHGPCFPIEEQHPLQKSLYHPFWEAMLQQFVIPITTKHALDVVGSAGFESMRS